LVEQNLFCGYELDESLFVSAELSSAPLATARCLLLFTQIDSKTRK
jgi:hypothetical protein